MRAALIQRWGLFAALGLTLAGDHRVSDGRRGGRFLLRIDCLLQEPEAL